MTKKCWVRIKVEWFRIRSERFGIDFATYLCSGIEFDWFMVESPSLPLLNQSGPPTHQYEFLSVMTSYFMVF